MIINDEMQKLTRHREATSSDREFAVAGFKDGWRTGYWKGFFCGLPVGAIVIAIILAVT